MNIFARVRTEEQLKAVMKCSCVKNIICPAKLYPAAGGREDITVFIDLPDIARENRADEIEQAANAAERAGGVVIKNVDELGLISSRGFKGRVIADSFLYAYNYKAVDFYRECIPQIEFMAPDELTDEEISAMRDSDGLIYKIYGHQRVMFTAQSFENNYSAAEAELESVKHDKLAARAENGGYTAIFTADPVDMTDSDVRWSNILADFTIEDAAETEAVLEVITRYSEGNVDTQKDKPRYRGHHFKGID